MDKYLLKDFERITELKSEIFRVDLNFLDLGDLETIQEYEADLGLEVLTYFDLEEIYNSNYDKIEEIYKQWCNEILEETKRLKTIIDNLEQKTIDKKRVLRDLCDLHYANGLHTGRWEDELAREESCEEYLATMITLAEKYHLNYDKNLENYIEDEDNPEYCTMDTMGFELQQIVEKYLLDIILNG